MVHVSQGFWRGRFGIQDFYHYRHYHALKDITPPWKLTWLDGKSPCSIWNTSSFMVNFPASHVKFRGDKTFPCLTFAIVLMLRYAPGQDSVLEYIEVHSLKPADISPLKIDRLCPQKAGCFIFQLLIFRDKKWLCHYVSFTGLKVLFDHCNDLLWFWQGSYLELNELRMQIKCRRLWQHVEECWVGLRTIHGSTGDLLPG